MLISSRQNEKIKRIKSLSLKESRYAEKLFLAEGSKTVREAISHNMSIKTLLLTESNEQLFDAVGAEKIIVTDDVFKSVSGEVSPEGVLAVIEMPDISVKSPRGRYCLLADGIADPGNMGTILRTAAAAGYTDVYLNACVDPFNPKAVRSSMSGIYFVRLNIGSIEEILTKLNGVPIISADMAGENVFGFNAPKKLCLAVGSEANGLSATVEAASTQTVKIPMEPQTESLNAAVSAGILMYLLKRED